MQPTPEQHLYFPKLRLLDMKWVEDGSDRYLHLRDPLGLTQGEVLIPAPLAPLLPLCDGEHNQPTIRAALQLWRGLSLTPEEMRQIVQQLDETLVLEGPRYQEARQAATQAYRLSPFRQPVLPEKVYPGSPVLLEKALDEYCRTYPPQVETGSIPSPVAVRGLLSPHIDYHRGRRVYAETWQLLEGAIGECEQVYILGTDHFGAPGRVTPTRQNYATPWGVLPNNMELTNALVDVLGEETALDQELHHTSEHSIELAAVWLHYFLRRTRGKTSFRNTPTVVPLLCGSMLPYTQGERDPANDAAFESVVEVLREAAQERRTLVVAAGDLAHVGPAFGDPSGLDDKARERLREMDETALDALCRGDAGGFFQGIQAEHDGRRVCGVTPVYLALRVLGEGILGRRLSYDQCPADAFGASVVSIAGVLWHR